MASESDGRKRGMGPVVAVVLVPLAILLLLFAPLIAAVVEHVMFGTRHVEDFFRRIGLHDELDLIYETVFDFLSRLFDF